MQTFVSNPYDMLNTKNKMWVDSLQIPSLKGGIGCKHPSDFLVILCQSIFKDSEPYQPSKDAPEKKHQRELTYVRSIYKYYNITQPEHWSPIKDISEVALEDVNNPGVFAFNQAVDGLRNYLTPTEDFINLLKEDIADRSLNCKNMAEEVISVTDECKFYSNKLDSIQEFVSQMHDSEAKAKLLAILNE